MRSSRLHAPNEKNVNAKRESRPRRKRVRLNVGSLWGAIRTMRRTGRARKPSITNGTSGRTTPIYRPIGWHRAWRKWKKRKNHVKNAWPRLARKRFKRSFAPTMTERRKFPLETNWRRRGGKNGKESWTSTASSRWMRRLTAHAESGTIPRNGRRSSRSLRPKRMRWRPCERRSSKDTRAILERTSPILTASLTPGRGSGRQMRS